MRRSTPTTILAVTLTALATVGAAGPFVPADDAEVLERLPYSPLDPAAQRSRALLAELRQRPGDPALAAELARQYIARGRALSDPRFYGYAQAALAAWWDLPDPPSEIRLLRATILQHDHEFEAALADLETLVARDPANVRAWLTRAVVQQVVGRYDEARESCVALLRLADPLVAATCVASVAGLQGSAARSYDVLRRTLERSPTADAATRVWASTALGELAARRGDAAAAEEHFLAALRLDRNDAYLLAAFADLLLDQRRETDVIALLGERRRIDALLLRLVIAEKRTGAAELEADRRNLEERFTAARRRGGAVHGREEARFRLEVLGRAEEGLQLALANWNVQREPLDARLVLEGALAAGRPAAAAPVLEFLRANRLEDARLAALAAQVASAIQRTDRSGWFDRSDSSDRSNRSD